MISELKKAPAFSLKDETGKMVSLKDFAGNKLALFFYPKDLTPTCTIQACNLRDNYSTLLKNGVAVVGINADDEKLHRKFKSKHDLPFPLLSDPDHKAIDKFGVWGEKTLFGIKYKGLIRTTFLIDEKGIIRKIITKPKSNNHSEEILKFWGIES